MKAALGAFMIRNFIAVRVNDFREWWRRPATAKDRVTSGVIGAFGGFWVGILGRMILGPMPISIETLAWWALGSIICGAILGVLFPKVIGTLLFPFSMFGVGSS